MISATEPNGDLAEFGVTDLRSRIRSGLADNLAERNTKRENLAHHIRHVGEHRAVGRWLAIRRCGVELRYFGGLSGEITGYKCPTSRAEKHDKELQIAKNLKTSSDAEVALYARR